MMGMEKMIAQMLGITPDDMGKMITGFQELLTGLQTRLSEIERKQDAILAHMGATPNEYGTDDGNDNRDASGGAECGSGRVAA